MGGALGKQIPALPRTLLLTHFPPSQRNGSIHHVSALLERYADSLVWYSTKAPLRQDFPSLPVPYGHGWLPDRPRSWPFAGWRRHWILGGWARRLGHWAANFGRTHGVELVWAELALEAVVAARVAAEDLGVPLVVTALDDPPSLLEYSGEYSRLTRWAFRRNFERTLRAAKGHGVISAAMAEDYAARYGIDPKVLYVGIDPAEKVPARLPPAGRRWIGSVGSVVSAANWACLLAAIRRLNQAAGEERFGILQIGELAEAFRAPEVEVTGWVQGDELRAHLARPDLFFLSMWFEPERRYAARHAFPTKIRTFLAAQRPILGLGPADSLALRFVRDEGVGRVCHEPDPAALATAIHGLLENSAYSLAVERLAAVADDFSRERYFATFEQFLREAVGRA